MPMVLCQHLTSPLIRNVYIDKFSGLLAWKLSKELASLECTWQVLFEGLFTSPFSSLLGAHHLTKLERVKSWLVLADHASGDRDLQREMSTLTSSLKEDLRTRKQERSQMANKELFKWIAPSSPANSHLRASKAKRAGTGKWFIDVV